MQAQVPPSVQATRPDGRSLAAASLCVMAPFFDLLGWLLAIAGIVLLRRASFSRTAKLLLVTIALAPKILFIGVRALTSPQGLSFAIEPRNLATTSSLWVWCIGLMAFGVYLVRMPRLRAPNPNAPIEPGSRRSPLIPALGFLLMAVALVVLLGFMDGFHRIDEAGPGRWALRHAARGNVAEFDGSELASIDATENHSSRGGSSYTVRVALAGGRSYEVTTKSSDALGELRKFATTANLPKGKVRILRRRGSPWISGASGFSAEDCVGTYELVDARNRSRSTFEFWLAGGRLSGKETVADPQGRHVRTLRNIRLSDSGDFEFQPATFVEASQQGKGENLSLSFRWSSQPETGRFVRNGLQVGLQKYTKQ
ncbi:MAG: hypothetical protein JST11_22355 [Acidobacteria bacterium]|nr:hypothetical protein [Acidobacteriota bacterium]